jgi:small subunit ribosomal protein S9
MADKKHYTYALGRRKAATARVRLLNGNGKFTVNNKSLAEYLDSSKYLDHDLKKPFTVLELDPKQFDVSVVVAGGGQHGQVEAIRLGIAKALAIKNEDLKGSLKRADLLGRDPRSKERKKFGLKGARKQRQFTKR